MQGQSGLGLDARRVAVERHAGSVGAEVIAEFQDVESGRKADRTGLAPALAAAKACGTRLGNLRLPAAGTLAAAPQPSTSGGKARTIAAQARAVACRGAAISDTLESP